LDIPTHIITSSSFIFFQFTFVVSVRLVLFQRGFQLLLASFIRRTHICTVRQSIPPSKHIRMSSFTEKETRSHDHSRLFTAISRSDFSLDLVVYSGERGKTRGYCTFIILMGFLFLGFSIKVYIHLKEGGLGVGVFGVSLGSRFVTSLSYCLLFLFLSGQWMGLPSRPPLFSVFSGFWELL